MGSKRYSDSQLIDAIVTSGTMPQAAKKIGCSVSALYRRMQDDAFRDRVETVRRKMFEDSVQKLMNARTAAINLLIDALQDEFEDTSTRIRAAALILQHTKALEKDSGGE